MTRFLAVLSGLLLITAVGIVMPWFAIAAAVFVVAGWWSRVCAVGAVLVALGALAWADSSVLAAAATGLVATTYLLNTATVSAPIGVVPTTLPSVAGAVSFAAVAVIATEVPVRFEWVPLAAPVLAVLVFAVVVHGVAARADD
ncbi:hypothetical protein [Nocardia macrotermitis]|uniref:Integral membrane protein n=1 Tax=Nocardia macrotermitis TaxID=2585198 RepID=A0A7K0CXF6_9NOCA|nr:hypothetical protein [Nocardia macrotermitis]MQY18101.1 hypothetical protein [Nocardia macrotermitis]